MSCDGKGMVLSMQKFQKKQLLEIMTSLHALHQNSREKLEQKEYEAVQTALADCQEAAIQIGEVIEQIEGTGTGAVAHLEQYCESIYQISIQVKEISAKKAYKNLEVNLIKAENAVRHMPEKIEAVFLPYKSSMWDSLESVWKAADEDPRCVAYVIPIPYYERNPDGSFKAEHYEGDAYPDYVPVTYYKDYNFEQHHPDVIFIHNPYDKFNKVTCVHPFFFSDNIQKYTDNLGYVPYYVVPGNIPDTLALTFGALNADIVFVQSQRIRKQYIKIFMDNINHIEHKVWEEKIVAMGSPKTDKIIALQNAEEKIPNEWKELIKKRKVCFFNTNVSLLLHNNEYFVQNLYRIFQIFEEYKTDFVVLWREHPLTMETINSMQPGLLDDYLELKEKFKEKRWGILDTTSDPHMAMAISDCYFGAGGSLVTIYSVTGKPMMITSYQYPYGISEEKIAKEDFYDSIANRSYYKEEHINSLQLFLENFEEICTFKEHRLKVITRCLDNLDGSVGRKIYEYTIGEDSDHKNGDSDKFQ